MKNEKEILDLLISNDNTEVRLNGIEVGVVDLARRLAYPLPKKGCAASRPIEIKGRAIIEVWERKFVQIMEGVDEDSYPAFFLEDIEEYERLLPLFPTLERMYDTPLYNLIEKVRVEGIPVTPDEPVSVVEGAKVEVNFRKGIVQKFVVARHGFRLYLKLQKNKMRS